MRPFHYAFKVKNLESTRKFYIDILGCEEGRSSTSWIDFDLYGNQLSAHISNDIPDLDYCGKVDGINVPIPHFGCILDKEEFKLIQDRLEAEKIDFIVRPQSRYKGKVGEQMTMFVVDYSGNPLEFKAFSKEAEVFTR